MTAKLRNYLAGLREHAEALETNYSVLEKEHAALQGAHTELKQETEETITQLDDENTDLRTQIEAMKQVIVNENGQGSQSSALSEGTVKVLRLFFEQEKDLSALLLGYET